MLMTYLIIYFTAVSISPIMPSKNSLALLVLSPGWFIATLTLLLTSTVKCRLLPFNVIFSSISCFNSFMSSLSVSVFTCCSISCLINIRLLITFNIVSYSVYIVIITSQSPSPPPIYISPVYPPFIISMLI